MSKVKSPREKKRLSLSRDRRNVYGENAKSSRKNIRRSKQLSHRAQRRIATATLGLVKGEVDEAIVTQVELVTRQKLLQSQRKAFRKRPDTPLGAVLGRKSVKAMDYRTPPRGTTTRRILHEE
jgi:hypothetical protein